MCLLLIKPTINNPKFQYINIKEFSSLCLFQLSCLAMCDSLQPQGLQPARLPNPSPIPRACSNSCPLSWWCHPTVLSSVVPFSPCLQSFPVSGPFPVSGFFASSGQSIGGSASVHSVNIQD